MMSVFAWILGSVVFTSLLSLIGVISLSVGKRRLHSFLLLFVAFASGSLLAAAFIHLIPEAEAEIGSAASRAVLAGIIAFFIFEKFIHWHHCGKEECDVRPVAYLNLVADGIHNFIDGVIIAAAYMMNVPVGVVTTIAILLHEIPQEFGDFSVLIHSGMETRKALTYNFISATSAVLGALLGYFFLGSLESMIPYALAVAAGGFIYIATADLMPELHKHGSARRMVEQSAALILGVLVLMASFHAVDAGHSHGDWEVMSDDAHIHHQEGGTAFDQGHDSGGHGDSGHVR
ncbi:MAG: ZIP family metal transporter [Candidatus Altiarchaeales archaeon]|nr:ZIP family metal transporter [Candidatus Altiarchaeales archaeon]MBD3417009.1 ZIP family metal transporter [Candidatus Altiarchaeales archaeon]